MPLSDTEVRKLQQHAPPQLREAEVVDPPLTPEGFIRVEVDGQRGDVKECPWVTRFSGVPVKGDAAAVIESDGGNFWALWWPQNGQEPSEGGGGGDEWFLFAGAPDPAQGTVGDLALSSTGSYYEKTDASTWTLRGSLLGPPGADGTDGTDGTPGTPGAPGESAYEIAVANGFVGTEEEWLASLEGPPGPPGETTEYALDTWHKIGDASTGLGSAFGGAGHWVHFSASDPTLPDVAFRKAPDGKVKLKGLALRQLTTAGAGDIIITGIPAAFRPTRTEVRTVHMSGTLSALRVDVKTDGTVVLQTGATVTVGNWLAFDLEWDSDTVTQMLAGPRGPAGGVVGAPPVVTSLPASPQDGEEVYYRFQQDVYPAAADWLVWHLRYDLAAGGWFPVGRVDPIFANQAAESTTAIAANTWTQFNVGVDAEFAFPLGGNYLIEWGAGRFWVSASGNWYIACFSTLSEQTNNGTQPNSDIACPPGVGTYSSGHASKRVTGVSAGQRQKLKYYSTAAGTLYASARYIKVYPRKLNAS